MKNLLIVLICYPIIFISLHCASTGQRGFVASGQSRILDAGFFQVFQTSLDYFRDLGYAIQKEDWNSGKIETEYKERSRLGNRELRSKIKATVSKITDNQTRLILEYLNEERELLGSWELFEYKSTDEMMVYDRHFEQITARIVGGRPIK